MIAGTAIPPIAAMIGRADFLTDESCPAIISLFISSPTVRKNMAMRASLIQCLRLISSENPPNEMPASVSHILSNHAVDGKDAIVTDIMVQMRRSTPIVAFLWNMALSLFISLMFFFEGRLFLCPWSECVSVVEGIVSSFIH